MFRKMPALSLTAAEAVTLSLMGALVALGSIIGYRAWRRSRISPEERERSRRSSLAAGGKINDATLVEIREDVLFYSYLVRGIEYTASQDISALKDRIPTDLGLGLGPVSVKYDPKNPANSIVVAEKWTGLRGKALKS